MLILFVSVGLFLAINALSLVIAGCRIWPRIGPKPQTLQRPPVSVVVPLCGIEEFSQETLDSAFRLDWPDYEIIFCVADAKDPVIPLIGEVRQRHPTIPATILVGDDLISKSQAEQLRERLECGFAWLGGSRRL